MQDPQITECIDQLAERCIELGDLRAACVLKTLAGARASGSEHELAGLCGAFSAIQLERIRAMKEGA